GVRCGRTGGGVGALRCVAEGAANCEVALATPGARCRLRASGAAAGGAPTCGTIMVSASKRSSSRVLFCPMFHLLACRSVFCPAVSEVWQSRVKVGKRLPILATQDHWAGLGVASHELPRPEREGQLSTQNRRLFP